jgi:hypothetical protein
MPERDGQPGGVSSGRSPSSTSAARCWRPRPAGISSRRAPRYCSRPARVRARHPDGAAAGDGRGDLLGAGPAPGPRPPPGLPARIRRRRRPNRRGPAARAERIRPLLPGSDQDHVWVPLEGRRSPGLALVTLQGAETGVSAPAPPYPTGGPIADGAGYVLFEAVGGIYQAGHGRTRRVSAGSLLAVGPGGRLTVECDDAVCRTVLRFRTGRGRRSRPRSARRRAAARSPRTAPPWLCPFPERSTPRAWCSSTSGRPTPRRAAVPDRHGRRRHARLDAGRWLLAVDASGRIQTVEPVPGASRC